MSMQGKARWFDGQQSQGQLAAVLLQDGQVILQAEEGGSERRFKLPDLRAGEAWSHSPRPVALPDGGTLWLQDASHPLLLALDARQPRRVRRLIDHMASAVLCLLLLLAGLAWFDRQGAALAASAAIEVLPRSVDALVGRKAYEQIEGRWFVATQVSQQRRDALEARFQAVARQQHPELSFTLKFARLKPARAEDGGFNAFALPDGTLVLLDGLVNALDDEELLAVLGHEVGHVVHRHGMHAVARTFALTSVASVALADFSTVAATMVAGLQTLRYSREAEREADEHAKRFLAAAGLPPQTLGRVWLKFIAEQRRRGGGKLPTWLSSHPTLEERSQSTPAAP